MPDNRYRTAANEQYLGGNLLRISEYDENRDRSAAKTRSALKDLKVGTSWGPGGDYLDSPLPLPASIETGELFQTTSISSDGRSTTTSEMLEAFPVPNVPLGRSITTANALDTTCPASDSPQIYFSPTKLNAYRKFELSSPQISPSKTPTQASFNAARIAAAATPVNTPISPPLSAPLIPSPSKSSSSPHDLTASELDMLVKSLVNSQLIQNQIRQKCGDCDPEERTSDARPRLAKEQRCTRDTVVRASWLQREFEHGFKERLSVLRAPRVKVSDVRLVDVDTMTSMVGASLSFVHIPREGALQVEVRLRLASPVLSRTTQTPRFLLVTDIDVTESFTKAAIIELLRISARSEREEDVWLEAAKDNEPSSPALDLVSKAATSFSALQRDSCTMQTLTLLSELERLRDQFSDFYIVRTLETHPTGVPSRLTVPLVSQSLHLSISPMDGKDLRELVVGVIGRQGRYKKAFTQRIQWDGDEGRLHCVPLDDRVEDGKTSWACFVRDGFDVDQW